MKNKTLLIMGMGFSSVSLVLVPPLFAILTFVISIMLLSRRYDAPGLYLIVSSIFCGILGTVFGIMMMLEVSIAALFINLLLNVIILLCMQKVED